MPRLKIIGLFSLLVVAGILASSQVRAAQDGNTCETLLAEAVRLAQESCSGLTPGNACTPSGSTIALEDIDTLQTSILNLEANQWDSALIQIPTGDQPIALAVFGGAQLSSQPESAPQVVEPLIAANKSGYNLNLRQGPGKDYEIAGFFGWDKQGQVDGRSADSEWLRLQTDSGYAWIATDLVSVQGDVSSLPIVTGEANPLQKFTLTTPDPSAACGAGSAGMLIAHTGSTNVGLQVNGANLRFDQATLLLQAQPNANLAIYVIDGQADVRANGEQITANRGETAEVALAGSDGLEADAPPLVKPSYPLNTLIGIPLELVSTQTLACTAGISGDAPLTSGFTAPNGDSPVVNVLVADAHYPVMGWVQDDTGNRWWQLPDAWVRQDTVQVTGDCESVPEADSNATVTSATTQVSTNSGATSSLFKTDLVPGEMIWIADPGQDILSGTCVMPPLPVCPHPTAVTPNGGTLTWRGQEPLPYTLRLTGDNAYSFSGRNNLNNANVTMSLTFTSTSTWMMTMTQVFDNDPDCVHTLYYNAVPR